MVRHKRNMRSGGSDSDNVGVCENIRGNVKINNPYVNQVVDRYNIQVEPLPYEYGTATGGGSYLSGQTAIVIATPLSGYTFVNWTENGTEVSTDSEYSFAVTQSRVLVANFVDPIFHPKHGLLYNWYAATDAGLIAASGWEVPTRAKFDTLKTYLGGDTVAGGKLKEVGFTYWTTPNTDATNEVGFNGRGAGVRQSPAGNFNNLFTFGFFWTSETYFTSAYNNSLRFNDAALTQSYGSRSNGLSIRLIKTTTSLSNGQTGTYTGNDGKVYRTICIGTQEWLADNLCETQFRNLEYILGFNAEGYVPFTDAVWAALTTAGVCAYEDNLANV